MKILQNIMDKMLTAKHYYTGRYLWVYTERRGAEVIKFSS